jgi:hypothetical protein
METVCPEAAATSGVLGPAKIGAKGPIRKGYTLSVNTTTVGDEISRIRKAMARWREMDAPGRLLGRGIGRREMVGRVAMETGATVAAVVAAIKTS